MTLRHLALALLLPAALAGCGSGDSEVKVAGAIRLHDGTAIVQAVGQPDARIAGSGELTINGQAVPLTAEERDLFRQYYVEAYKLRDQGLAIRRTGSNMAAFAIGSAASSPAGGASGKSAGQRNDQTTQITHQAAILCDSLDRLRATQDVIAGQLPAFRPYASLKDGKVRACRDGLKDSGQALAAH